MLHEKASKQRWLLPMSILSLTFGADWPFLARFSFRMRRTRLSKTIGAKNICATIGGKLKEY